MSKTQACFKAIITNLHQVLVNSKWHACVCKVSCQGCQQFSKFWVLLYIWRSQMNRQTGVHWNISKAKKTDGLVIIDLGLLHLSSAIPWGGGGGPGQIQLCMGTYRGFKILLYPGDRGNQVGSIYHILAPWGKPRPLFKEIRLISSCLKSKAYIHCRPLV